MQPISKFRRLFIVGLVLSLVIIFAGCSKIAEKATEKAVEKTTGVTVDKGEGKVKVKTKEGEAEIQAGTKKLPEGFPEKFPIYEDAKIKVSSKVSGQGGTNFSVAWEADADVQKVSDFYKNELPESGYEIANAMESDESTVFTLKGGMVQVFPEEDKTIIQVTLSEK